MGKPVRYLYELTDRMGAQLYEALREEDFDEVIEREYEYYLTQAGIGGESREAFIDWLLQELSDSDREEFEERAGGEELAAWLMSHPAEGIEESYRERYAREEVEFASSGLIKSESGKYLPSLWAHLHIENDAEVARFFGLISNPPTDATGRHIDSKRRDPFPSEIANEIKALNEEADALETALRRGANGPPHEDLHHVIQDKISVLRHRARLLDQNTMLGLILISGFDCTVHGGTVRFDKPIPRAEIIGCPACGYPICPFCANCYAIDPSTVEQAEGYLASCDEVSGMAYCGQCGDWSVGFMLRFLRLKRCPIPDRYKNHQPEARKALFVTTNRVAALPNREAILQSIAEKFTRGASGIISEKDPSGEIWGIPERHPEGWVVTVCYPEER
ncbi:MAG: hypothetical protein MPW13_22455 (plasmid) [Candidatus Manganitrophus sp.]|nr:hypothetical protein [Candidatus Manganitrophus sp.]